MLSGVSGVPFEFSAPSVHPGMTIPSLPSLRHPSNNAGAISTPPISSHAVPGLLPPPSSVPTGPSAVPGVLTQISSIPQGTSMGLDATVAYQAQMLSHATASVQAMAQVQLAAQAQAQAQLQAQSQTVLQQQLLSQQQAQLISQQQTQVLVQQQQQLIQGQNMIMANVVRRDEGQGNIPVQQVPVRSANDCAQSAVPGVSSGHANVTSSGMSTAPGDDRAFPGVTGDSSNSGSRVSTDVPTGPAGKVSDAAAEPELLVSPTGPELAMTPSGTGVKAVDKLGTGSHDKKDGSNKSGDHSGVPSSSGSAKDQEEGAHDNLEASGSTRETPSTRTPSETVRPAVVGVVPESASGHTNPTLESNVVVNDSETNQASVATRDVQVQGGASENSVDVPIAPMMTLPAVMQVLLSNEVGEIMRTATYGSRGKGERRIDLEHLTRRHEWMTVRMRDMSFRLFVLEETEKRPDMLRFYESVLESGEQETMDKWSQFLRTHLTWFKIPTTLKCSRTFVRDELEAIYVDWMDAFVTAKPRDFSVNNIPLVKMRHALTNRWWNRPRNVYGLTLEALWWALHNIMVPFDSYDVPMTAENIAKLKKLYPGKLSWWNTTFFPVIVPCPSPLVLFYYHIEWMRSATKAELEFWELLFELEHAVLYAACWWYEATRYGRAVVLPEDTISWLKERLNDLVIDPLGPNISGTDGQGPVRFSFIESRMYQAASMPSEFKNEVRFKAPHDRLFSRCTFVYCEKFTGSMDGNVPVRKRLVREMNGNMYLDNNQFFQDEQHGQN